MRLLFIFIVSSLSLLPLSAVADNNDTLAIIVGPQQDIKVMSKSELALIFWRKKLYWSDGQRIRPVNLSADHHTRNQFSKRVLNSLPESQTDYWNGLYYHGVSPPHVVQSSAAALRFVAETKGAIAYVPACDLDESVKAIAWLDAETGFHLDAPQLNCPE